MKISKEDLTELFARYVDGAIAKKAAYLMVSRKHNIKQSRMVIDGYCFQIHILSGNRRYVSVAEAYQHVHQQWSSLAKDRLHRCKRDISKFDGIIEALEAAGGWKRYAEHRLCLNSFRAERNRIYQQYVKILDAYGYTEQPSITEEEEIALWRANEAVPIKTRLKMDRSPAFV
jgi:hypothetical protein